MGRPNNDKEKEFKGFRPIRFGWDRRGVGMRMIRPDDFGARCPRLPDGGEVVGWVDSVSALPILGHVARPDGRANAVAVPQEEAAALLRRRFERVGPDRVEN
jgi:hypothetical protein